MGLLFTQYWDVMPKRSDEYSRFISDEYIPAINKLSIRLVGGYYVVVGQGPRIVAVAEVQSLNGLQRSLETREYREVSTKLLDFVWNYGSKVWAPAGKIQEGPYLIQTGVWKFNQYYNVLRGKEEAHRRYVKDECMPAMKEIGIPLTGGWRQVVGTGPTILAESTAKGIVDIAKAIDSREFRHLVSTLKNDYATDYSSRILAPTGRIEVPYFMGEMMKKF